MDLDDVFAPLTPEQEEQLKAELAERLRADLAQIPTADNDDDI